MGADVLGRMTVHKKSLAKFLHSDCFLKMYVVMNIVARAHLFFGVRWLHIRRCGCHFRCACGGVVDRTMCDVVGCWV